MVCTVDISMSGLAPRVGLAILTSVIRPPGPIFSSTSSISGVGLRMVAVTMWWWFSPSTGRRMTRAASLPQTVRASSRCPVTVVSVSGMFRYPGQLVIRRAQQFFRGDGFFPAGRLIAGLHADSRVCGHHVARGCPVAPSIGCVGPGTSGSGSRQGTARVDGPRCRRTRPRLRSWLLQDALPRRLPRSAPGDLGLSGHEVSAQRDAVRCSELEPDLEPPPSGAVEHAGVVGRGEDHGRRRHALEVDEQGSDDALDLAYLVAVVALLADRLELVEQRDALVRADVVGDLPQAAAGFSEVAPDERVVADHVEGTVERRGDGLGQPTSCRCRVVR